MSHQSVILPDASLMIVDRGWQRSKKRRDTVTGSKPPQSHSQTTSTVSKNGPVDDIEVTIMKVPSRNSTISTASTEANLSTRRTSMQQFPQDFQFINAVDPFHTRDPLIRRLVKSHAMRKKAGHVDPKQRKDKAAKGKTATTIEPNISSAALHAQEPLIDEFGYASPPCPCLGSVTSFYGLSFPFEMTAKHYRLVDHYLTDIARQAYPLDLHLQYNPMRRGFVRFAATDDMLLKTILLLSSCHLLLIGSSQDPDEFHVLLTPVLRQLTARLHDNVVQSDTTIAAVSYLAKIENLRGNGEQWKMHMNALKEMIRMRGGLEMIDTELQMMIYRADIVAAADLIADPFLPSIQRCRLPTYSVSILEQMGDGSGDFQELLAASGIDLRMSKTLFDLFRISRAIELALNNPSIKFNPQLIDEDINLIQYELLTLPNLVEETALEHACRIGALIYVKTLRQTMPVRRNSVRVSITQLKSSRARVPADPKISSLVMWLFFLGGIASQELPEEQVWFRRKLVAFTEAQLRSPLWDEINETLGKILWIESIHGKHGKALWSEIELTKGGTCPCP